MMSNRSVRSMLKAAIAAILTVMVCIQPARAQFGMGGGDMTQYMVPITKKALENYAGLVGMDKAQKEAAIALQEGYRSSFKQLQADIQKTMKEMMEKVQDSGDWASMGKEMAKTGKDMTEKMEKLEKGFLEDVKSLLNDKQKEMWPRVERTRRRETAMRFSLMAGQNVDLVKMMQAVGAKIDAPPELAEQVDRYEVEMDRQLKAFEVWGKDQQAKQVKQMEEGGMNFDFTKIQEMMKEMATMAKGMRDTNRQYAKSIQALLPADKQTKFDYEIKKKSFPRVYKESYASKAFAEAEKFNDLDAGQKDALATLKDGYLRELEAANKAWAAAIEDREEKLGGTMGAMMAGFMPGGEKDKKDEVGDARKARKELDTRTKEKLLAVLKEDQKSRLSEDKPDPKEKQGFDFMPFEPAEPDEE